MCPCFFSLKGLKTYLCLFSSFYWGGKNNILRKTLKTFIPKRLCIHRREVAHNILHTMVLETAIASTWEQVSRFTGTRLGPCVRIPSSARGLTRQWYKQRNSLGTQTEYLRAVSHAVSLQWLKSLANNRSDRLLQNTYSLLEIGKQDRKSVISVFNKVTNSFYRRCLSSGSKPWNFITRN